MFCRGRPKNKPRKRSFKLILRTSNSQGQYFWWHLLKTGSSFSRPWPSRSAARYRKTLSQRISLPVSKLQRHAVLHSERRGRIPTAPVETIYLSRPRRAQCTLCQNNEITTISGQMPPNRYIQHSSHGEVSLYISGLWTRDSLLLKPWLLFTSSWIQYLVSLSVPLYIRSHQY